jgi:hypothetical protein
MSQDVKSEQHRQSDSQNLSALDCRTGPLAKSEKPQFDFLKAARCGARTRRGTQCQSPAMSNGRCRLHGGLSTGPRTAEGIERIRRAVTRHGRYTKAAKQEQRRARNLLREARAHLFNISQM